MKTAVMTDSNSGIKPEEGEKLGVFSLSMPVIIDLSLIHIFIRRDYWKVKPEEIKRMAGDRKIWIIKCPAPDSNAKAGWGDFYFANSLAKNLEKLGIYPVVDLYEDWSCELMADCVIAVSYTHLDVYKRQGRHSALFKKEIQRL